ncbi:12707_t:CDS:10, partial [Dentiscutata heterogama]
SGNVHKYFERKASEWNIVGFLNECEIEPFERKIECYITSLEYIANSEKNRRGEMAQSLIDKYKKVSKRMGKMVLERRWPSRLSDVQAVLLGRMLPSRLPAFKASSRPGTGPVERRMAFEDDKPDRKLAREWEGRRSHNHIHLRGIINGTTINRGTVGTINGIVSLKRDIHDNQDNNKIPKRVKINDYFPVREASQHERDQPQTSENQTRTARETSPPSITSMHSLYVSSSPNSSINEEYIRAGKNTYRLFYFTGPGVLEWHLNEHSIRWIVSDVDISEICLENRAEVIKRCEPMAVILDAFEELALSHVFVFQEESPCGLCEHFDDELWEDLFVEFQELYPFYSIPNMIYDLFANIIKITCETQNRRERQAVARSYLKYKVTTEEEGVMVEIFKDLIDNEQSSFRRNNAIEDTHIIQNVTPIIIRPFFKNNRKIVFDGANKMSESSAIAQRRFDPVLLGMKPDFTVKTTNPKKHVELLIGEIKPKKGGALVSEDLVSLGKMMKCALDKSIEDGVDDLDFRKGLCDGPS